MALGTISRVGSYSGGEPASPTFHDVLSFLGDGAYPTGGTAAIAAAIAAVSGMAPKTIVAIKHLWSSTPKYILEWDRANDKLRVLDTNTGAENVTANLSGVTFEIEVVSR
jgi:hypothetical protein